MLSILSHSLPKLTDSVSTVPGLFGPIFNADDELQLELKEEEQHELLDENELLQLEEENELEHEELENELELLLELLNDEELEELDGV